MNMDCFMKRYLGVLMNDDNDHEFISVKMLTGGTTSHRIGKLLNFAVSQIDDAECYLEVGVFLGTTLCSAAHANSHTCIGIDNYDPEMLSGMTAIPPAQILARCLHNTKQFSPNIKVIAKSFRDVAKEEIAKPVAVSFIDGKHTYGEVHDNLAWLEPLLADHAIIVFDDATYCEVKDAIFDWIMPRKEHYDLTFFAKPYFTNNNNVWSISERFLNNGLCLLRYHRPTEKQSGMVNV